MLVHDPLRLCYVLAFLHRHMASYAPTEIMPDPLADENSFVTTQCLLAPIVTIGVFVFF